jgi:hypothetical protein
MKKITLKSLVSTMALAIGTLTSTTSLASLLGLAITIAFSGTARADADLQRVCGPQTLRGLYVFAIQGPAITGGVEVPQALLEGIRFNGDGTLISPSSTLNFNGDIFRIPNLPGTYTVEADCTGTYTHPGIATADLIVAPSGDKFWFIQTGPGGAVISFFAGSAERVSR